MSRGPLHPKHRYAQEVLAIYVLEHSHPEAKFCNSISATLRRALYDVKYSHFIVPYTSFTTNFASAIRYLKSFQKRKTKYNYKRSLARAMVHCNGLLIPENAVEEYSWVANGDEEFVTFFKAEVRSQKGSIANYQGCSQYEILAEELSLLMDDLAVENQYAAEKALHDALEMLESLPTKQQVQTVLGGDAAQTYANTCEHLEATDQGEDAVDVENSQETGGGERWNKRRIEDRLDLLNVYVATRGIPNDEAVAEFEQWFKRRSERNKEETDKKRKRATDLGIWRMYDTEREQWSKALTLEEMEVYEVSMKAIRRTVLRGGCYQHIPRRKFSEKNVEEMRSDVLVRLGEVVRVKIKQNET